MQLRVSNPKTIPVPFPPPPHGNPLGVHLFRQKQTQWCWAACAEMVLDFYNKPNADQCALANLTFAASGGGCCKTPSSSFCNKPLHDPQITQLWAAKNIKSTYIQSYVSFAILQGEIGNGRPVEVGLSQNGGGHVVIVQGTSQTNMGQYVLVNDPASNGIKGTISYSDLKAAPGLRVWDATWIGLRR